MFVNNCDNLSVYVWFVIILWVILNIQSDLLQVGLIAVIAQLVPTIMNLNPIPIQYFRSFFGRLRKEDFKASAEYNLNY